MAEFIGIMTEQKIVITEGLLIAGVPVIGYWVAFLYELGYCRYFDIPASFIVVSVASIFLSVLGVFGVLALIIIFLEPVFNVFRGLSPAVRSPIARVLVASIIIAAFSLVNRLALSQILLIACIVNVPFLASYFIKPLFRYKDVKDYLAKL